MEVFALGLNVKESGAATVDAAMERLRSTVKAVGDEATAAGEKMGRAFGPEGPAGRIDELTRSRLMTAADAGSMRVLHEQALAMDRTFIQSTARKTEAIRTVTRSVALSRTGALTAASGFAVFGQQLGRTGTVGAGAIGRLVAGGARLGAAFGPAGLAVAGVVAFGTAMVSKMRAAQGEVEKTVETARKALRDLINAGDIETMQKEMRDLFLGTPAEKFADGIRSITARLAELRAAAPRDAIGALAELANPERLEEIARLEGLLGTATDRFGALRTAVLDVVNVPWRGSALDPVVIGSADEAIAERERQMRRLAAATAAATGRIPVVGGVAPLPPGFKSELSASFAAAQLEARKAAATLAIDLRESLAENIAGAVTGGIVAGIEMGIGSGRIGEGFRALADQMLSGLGSAMIEFGVASLKLGTLMQGLVNSFASLLPGGAIGKAVAMIALGAALKGVARRAFGSGGAGGGFGSGFSPAFAPGGGAPEVTRIVFGPTSSALAAGMTTRQVTNVTVIGPNDPNAQRAIEELLRKGQSRGGI